MDNINSLEVRTASTYAKGDGTFYISYDDMLKRFHHLDVAKTRESWVDSVSDGMFITGRDPLTSSQLVYFFNAYRWKKECVIVINNNPYGFRIKDP